MNGVSTWSFGFIVPGQHYRSTREMEWIRAQFKHDESLNAE